MTRTEKFLGWLSGKILVLCGRLALRRGDTHELNHVMAALYYGNSNHGHSTCKLPRNMMDLMLLMREEIHLSKERAVAGPVDAQDS